MGPKECVSKFGYAFLSEHFPNATTSDVANSLGTPRSGSVPRDLIPAATATPNTYSGIYGLDRFPFHTDLAHWSIPPRYILLRCLIGYVDVATLLLDGRSIVDTLGLETLTRAIFKPRRPQEGVLTLLRLCEPVGDGYYLRWDETFIKPASKVAEVVQRRIGEYLFESSPSSIAMSRPGDTLLIDNWRMLHSRSAIPAGREDRKIQRIYLECLH